MAKRSYGNRSEAMRDMIREQLGSDALDLGEAKWCIATLTYVYDRIEPAVAARVVAWQHAHHDLVVSTSGTPLDHRDFLETVVARGKTVSLQACARELVATRGVRYGNIHLVPLLATPAHTHSGGVGDHHSHRHLRPLL